ncbi:class I SAM-dependent methyltransferase [Sabulilitoribacter multivorans]|uniref:Class I SAM-dependent methyltransferase n=1 Tax=Flaviramulus multivorans TaxID=1304750 RepID=A0ABS9IFA1_9FLAO|nr:class I SAM-dependent methyltransferase [Flaviramulus multivorans]
MIEKIKKPWPTKNAMTQVYKKKLWGGNAYDFYSGYGSHDSNITTPYIEVVRDFLTAFKEPLVVCDLGCGDFNIGKNLVHYTKKYIAIDIVESLITRNKKMFVAENLEFFCLDIVKDELPPADCIILRQVLQHVSNAEILNVVDKLYNFKYIILTEHIPLGTFAPNKDIISGQGIRLKQNSGVNILEPPFNLKVIDKTVLNEHILKNNKGRIVTTLYKLF